MREMNNFSRRAAAAPLILPKMHAADFFSLPESLVSFAPYFPAESAPWDWLRKIGPALAAAQHAERNQVPRAAAPIPPGVHIEGWVHIDPTVKLPAYATLIGPLWIGPGTEIRPGAYLRGNVIVGSGCVLGNACEFKNALLLDRVQVPHFSYVGDSVLGNRAHLGAGVVCSNLRLDQAEIAVEVGDQVVMTGLRKFGAILGDEAEVGCNAVLMPGTMLGPRSVVMPLTPFGGVLDADTSARCRPTITRRRTVSSSIDARATQ